MIWENRLCYVEKIRKVVKNDEHEKTAVKLLKKSLCLLSASVHMVKYVDNCDEVFPKETLKNDFCFHRY